MLVIMVTTASATPLFPWPPRPTLGATPLPRSAWRSRLFLAQSPGPDVPTAIRGIAEGTPQGAPVAVREPREPASPTMPLAGVGTSRAEKRASGQVVRLRERANGDCNLADPRH